jgi:hypothetical protein
MASIEQKSEKKEEAIWLEPLRVELLEELVKAGVSKEDYVKLFAIPMIDTRDFVSDAWERGKEGSDITIFALLTTVDAYTKAYTKAPPGTKTAKSFADNLLDIRKHFADHIELTGSAAECLAEALEKLRAACPHFQTDIGNPKENFYRDERVRSYRDRLIKSLTEAKVLEDQPKNQTDQTDQTDWMQKSNGHLSTMVRALSFANSVPQQNSMHAEFLTIAKEAKDESDHAKFWAKDAQMRAETLKKESEAMLMRDKARAEKRAEDKVRA